MKYPKVTLSLAISTLLSAGAIPSIAQTSQKLSLQQAVNLGLNNSKSLKASAAVINEAKAELEDTKNNRLPDIKISGSYMRVNHPDISLKFQMDNSGGGSSIPDIKPNSLMYGMAMASVPVYAGGQITNAINSAQYLVKAAELDAVSNRDSVIMNIVAAYYNLYKAQAALHLVEENLNTSKQRVKDFKNLETNGLVARNDLLKVELQESNTELSLVDAENQLRVVNYNFNLLLGQDGSIRNDVDTTGMGLTADAGAVADWETLALNSRSDLHALEQRLTALDYGIKATKGTMLPTLAVSGGYVAMDIPKVMSITNALNIGVGVSYNLANLYKAKAKIKKAEAQKEELYWDQQALSDGVRMQVYSAYSDYLNTLKKIQVYKVAVAQADENYRVTKNKYDNSLATTTDLLDADVAKLQANINYEYAKADAMVSYNRLYKVSGTVNASLVK